MELTETENEVLQILKDIDTGDMMGAHWPVVPIVKKFDIESDDIAELFKGLERKGFVSLKGGAPCACITTKGREALKRS